MSRERDRILEQALKHELSAAGTPPAAPPAVRSFSEGGCLDAETLGAWVDGGLDAAAMAAAEIHLANCARCQSLAGTLARSAPVVESTEARGFPLWKWWLAPIAAGVTAVTLWTVIPEQPQVAVAPPVVTPSREASAEPRPQFAPEAAPNSGLAAGAERQRSPVDTFAAGAREDRPQEKDKAERKQVAAVQESVALADSAVPAPASPPPPAAVALESPALGSLAKSARAEIAAIEIAMLDPSLGWRIVGDRIERSDNAGRTWTVKRSSGDGIVAGSAPSNSVGWFVGRAGRVLLTTDSGATFTDVSLAEPLDLASVAAIDARNASIFSVVGRRFRTDDGGRTWRPF